MKKVLLTTDGSCLGNPGPGGWACVLRFGSVKFGSVKREFFGFDPRTTNNRMELMAPIQGLLALKEPARWRSRPTPSTYFMGSRNGSPSGSGGIGGGSMSRCAIPISGWNLTSWSPCTRQPGYGPGVTPATKTTPGATGCHRMQQPDSEVPGRMDGPTLRLASAWVRTMCRQNRKLTFSMT